MTTDYPLLNGVIFAALGVALFLAAFALMRRMVPGDLWKEILQERNVALAVLVGLMAVGLAVIIGETLH